MTDAALMIIFGLALPAPEATACVAQTPTPALPRKREREKNTPISPPPLTGEGWVGVLPRH
jgi:hypothetical protein